MDALRIHGKPKFRAEFNCRRICKQRVAGSNPAVGSRISNTKSTSAGHLKGTAWYGLPVTWTRVHQRLWRRSCRSRVRVDVYSIRRSVMAEHRIASRHGDPNQVVSASRNPVSVPSPTQATYPSGRMSTAAGAATWPRTGSSQLPAYLALIANNPCAHGEMSKPHGLPRLRRTAWASWRRVNTR